jgi:epoxide hydrolase
MQLRPFQVHIPQDSVDDLRRRLDGTRWATRAAEDYGLTVDWVRRLAGYWRDGFDWRAQEARLNQYPQFIAEVDGQDIHFVHVRSGKFPLILSHGWPGSVVEYLDLIPFLAEDFDLVIPSLPGFAFSSPLTGAGWSTRRTAGAWDELMTGLGYERYIAVGNDAGSMICSMLAQQYPARVTGAHVTQVFSYPSGDPAEFADLTREEGAQLGKLQWLVDNKISFSQVLAQQPQTLAHALADSPAGLLGWNGQLLSVDAMGEEELDDDFIVTNVSLYWFTNTAGSASRFYYEDARDRLPPEPTTVPLAVSGFAGDFTGVRRFAERDHKNIVQWRLHPEPGGHYAAHLYPDILAADIGSFFAELR